MSWEPGSYGGKIEEGREIEEDPSLILDSSGLGYLDSSIADG